MTKKIKLLRPLVPNSLANPILSIVVPALNEEITITEFVDWCKVGLSEAGIQGQILIVDSSSDETPQLAIAGGAEVLLVPKRGLGRAYIDAIPFIRGKWVLMGDADLTYDFRKLSPFIAKFKAGKEFIMGSRFKGYIERGAMPLLHQYFGTPLTTWILNFLYRTRFTDIHCGMRGITLDALKKINLESQGWEYASEMVLKAARYHLKIGEVPVAFFKDRAGRVSHHRRMGWISPWIAGWTNLRVMLVYTPDSFLIKPGIISMLLGLVISTPLIFGPISFAGMGFDLYTMLLGLSLSVFGYAIFQVGIISRLIHGYRSGIEIFIQKKLTYNNGIIISIILIFIGLIFELLFLKNYLSNGLRVDFISYTAIEGLLLILVGVQTFGFTLIVELINISMAKKELYAK
jgi:glycosyltransferase involved in cell wall biosynthesis